MTSGIAGIKKMATMDRMIPSNGLVFSKMGVPWAMMALTWVSTAPGSSNRIAIGMNNLSLIKCQRLPCSAVKLVRKLSQKLIALVAWLRAMLAVLLPTEVA